MTKKTKTANTGNDHINETARDYAKKNIREVKAAQENFLEAMSQAQAQFLQSAGMSTPSDGNDFNDKALNYMKTNMETGFELATKLVDATDVSEAVELQNEYVRKQLETYTEQAQELSDLIITTPKDKS